MPKLFKKPKVYIPTIIFIIMLAFLGVFVFFQKENQAASEWEKMTPPTNYNAGIRLNDVVSVFSEASKQYHAWAVGNDLTNGVLIYYTGIKWVGLTFAGTADSTTADLRGAAFIFHDNGTPADATDDYYEVWLVGRGKQTGNEKGFICYYSIFQPWNPNIGSQAVCAQQGGGNETLNSIFAYDASTIYAVGNKGTILKNNGGNNWIDVSVGGPNDLQSIYIVTNAAGTNADAWAVGTGAKILRNSTAITNPGAWNNVSAPADTGNLNSVAFIDANYGWAGGSNNIDGGPQLIYWPTAGPWISKRSDISASRANTPVTGISATKDSYGRYYIWASGQGNVSEEGYIAYFSAYPPIAAADTQTWLQQNTGLGLDESLYGVHAANDTHAWAVGHTSGSAPIILKLSPGNVTGWAKIGADNCQDNQICLDTGAGCTGVSCEISDSCSLNHNGYCKDMGAGNWRCTGDGTTECTPGSVVGVARTYPAEWVSLNCANTGTCNTTSFSYGVNIKKRKLLDSYNEYGYNCKDSTEDTDVGGLSGYAWIGMTDTEQRDNCPVQGKCSNDSSRNCYKDTDCVSPGTCLRYCKNNSSQLCVSSSDCQSCQDNPAYCKAVGWISFDRNEIGNPPALPYNTANFQTPCEKTINTANPPFNYITATFDYATRKLDGWGRMKLGKCSNDNKIACFSSSDCGGNTCVLDDISEGNGWVKLRGSALSPVLPNPYPYSPCYGCITKTGTSGTYTGEYLECPICSREDWSCHKSMNPLSSPFNCGTGRCSNSPGNTCIVRDPCILQGNGTCVENPPGTWKCTKDGSTCVDNTTATDRCMSASGKCYLAGVCQNHKDVRCLTADNINFITSPLITDCGSCNYLGYNTCNQMDSCDSYGVSLDLNAGDFYGYAWSPDLGWISFNGANMYNVAWLQEKYSDIYSQANIGSIFTGKAPGSSFLAAGKCNATFLIQADGSITRFCSSGKVENVSPDTATTTGRDNWTQGDWSAQGFGYVGFPKAEKGYTNVFGKLDYSGIIASTNNKYGIYVSEDSDNFISRFSGSTYNNILGGRIFKINVVNQPQLEVSQPLQFKNDTAANPNGAGLIVIEGGDLIINDNMTYEDTSQTGLDNIKKLASVGFIVKSGTGVCRPNHKCSNDSNKSCTVASDCTAGGNIIIGSDVQNIVGNFFAEGKITVNNRAGNDDALKVSGLMIASQFEFKRKFKGTIDNPQPAEVVIYDGRLLANTPPGFQDLASLLPLFSEVSP